MEKRRLGNTDMEVSVLGFGGAEIGFTAITTERVTELLNDALDAGLNVIDSAAAYLERVLSVHQVWRHGRVHTLRLVD